MSSRPSSRGDESGEERIFVEDGGARRPFMRGILTHSLMARGVSFEDAFRTANEVRAKIRERCDTNDRGARERINTELDRLLKEYRLAAGKQFEPMPTCAEV